MNRIKITLFFLLFLIFNTNQSFAQLSLSENTKVSILTCDKGNELYSLFGHTAIRINDPNNSLDIVYNFGAFDFRTENFYLKFIKGDLQYFVTAYSFSDFYYEYTIENRSIYEQVLNINNVQQQVLFDDLNNTLFSDKKYYTYKFIDRNCTTMVVDKINHILNGNYIVKTTEKNKTYREILFPYINHLFFENLGINIIFGEKVDRLGQKLFLPFQFLESLKVTTVNKTPLVDNTEILLKAKEFKSITSLWNNIYFFSLIILLIIVSKKKWSYIGFLSVLGCFGVFLSLVGFYSFHQEVTMNYNTLLFNPSLLFLSFFIVKENKEWIKKICIFNLVCLGIFSMVLINKPNLVMFSPMIIASAVIHFYFLRKAKLKLNI
jgi:hypothetical protein